MKSNKNFMTKVAEYFDKYSYGIACSMMYLSGNLNYETIDELRK